MGWRLPGRGAWAGQSWLRQIRRAGFVTGKGRTLSPYRLFRLPRRSRYGKPWFGRGSPGPGGFLDGQSGVWDVANWCFVDLVDRTRASIHLIWLRLRLPGRLAAASLDELFDGLGARGAEFESPVAGAAGFTKLERALDRAEALAERLPRLPRTCLYRCLARYAVYRRCGFPAEFVMGISPLGPDHDGHAWLEFSGKPYREERAAEFVVSFRYPPRVA